MGGPVPRTEGVEIENRLLGILGRYRYLMNESLVVALDSGLGFEKRVRQFGFWRRQRRRQVSGDVLSATQLRWTFEV